MGLPTILPHHTGFSDYVSDKTSFTFDVDAYEICDNNPDWRQWITRMYAGHEFPIFGQSVVDNVSELMRSVKNNPILSKNKVNEMNKIIEEKYTWDKCILSAEDYFKNNI